MGTTYCAASRRWAARRWDNTPEPLDPLLTEVQHALPAKVRKGKHVSAAAIIVAIMVVDWLVMTGTPLISIILAGAVAAAIALAFSASARHEDEREMRTDNFIEAAHQLLGVKGLSRNLVNMGRWKRTPLPAPAAAEDSGQADTKGESQEASRRLLPITRPHPRARLLLIPPMLRMQITLYRTAENRQAARPSERPEGQDPLCCLLDEGMPSQRPLCAITSPSQATPQT